MAIYESFATSVSTTTIAGEPDWSDVSNLIGDNDNIATLNVGSSAGIGLISGWLRCKFANLNIPDGVDILGFQLEWIIPQRSGGSGSIGGITWFRQASVPSSFDESAAGAEFAGTNSNKFPQMNSPIGFSSAPGDRIDTNGSVIFWSPSSLNPELKTPPFIWTPAMVNSSSFETMTAVSTGSTQFAAFSLFLKKVKLRVATTDPTPFWTEFVGTQELGE